MFTQYYSSRARVSEALRRLGERRAVATALRRFSRLKSSLSKRLDLEALAERLSEARRRTLAQLSELVKQAAESLEENGFQVHYARDAREARRIAEKLVEPGSLVVKSKSSAIEEAGIAEHLRSLGSEVYETDLGEYAVQLARSHRAHPIVPALHLSREKIAELVSMDVGYKVPPDPREITKAVRRRLREVFTKAGYGLTGANFISAEEGVIALVSNEGNIRNSTSFPKTHIAVAGLNKVVRDLDEGLLVIRALAPFSIGSRLPSYVSLIAGPSKTADIELETVVGVHGPSEVHVILLDNGRSRAWDLGVEEALCCINCGGCLNECPAYTIAGRAYGHVYKGGIGVVYTALTEGLEKAVEAGLYLCTTCGRCVLSCPCRINTPALVERLREAAARRGLMAEPHYRWLSSPRELQDDKPLEEQLPL